MAFNPKDWLVITTSKSGTTTVYARASETEARALATKMAAGGANGFPVASVRVQQPINAMIRSK